MTSNITSREDLIDIFYNGLHHNRRLALDGSVGERDAGVAETRRVQFATPSWQHKYRHTGARVHQ